MGNRDDSAGLIDFSLEQEAVGCERAVGWHFRVYYRTVVHTRVRVRTQTHALLYPTTRNLCLLDQDTTRPRVLSLSVVVLYSRCGVFDWLECPQRVTL